MRKSFLIFTISRVLFVMLLTSLLLADVAVAQLELRFQPPREATLRKKNRSMIQGSLLQFSASRVRIQPNGVGNVLEVPLKDVQSLLTTDGEFQFNQAMQPQDAISLGSRLDGVTMEAVESPPMPNTTLPSIPAAQAPITLPSDPSDPELASPPAEPASSTPAPVLPPAGSVLVTCGSCGRDATVTAQTGQKCPHCGVVWVSDLTPAVTFTPPAPETVQGNFQPGGPVAAAPQHGQPAQPSGGGAIQLNVPSPPMSFQNEPMDFNLATMPTWVKGALFLVALLGCYFVMFNRS